MTNTILVSLTILTFFTVGAIAQQCASVATADPALPTATVFVNNPYYDPDCLTVHDGQFVEWVWSSDDPHTVTSNGGPLGDCSSSASPVMPISGKGDTTGATVISPQPFKYNPNATNELFYNCIYHCPLGMSGKVTVIP